ncbi:MAG: HNH endonuclease [Alkalilacustris sp.]
MKQETRKHWEGHGSAHARGYGAKWRRLRAFVLARDKGLCQVCLNQGRTTQATEVDHILNRARGGTDHTDNLQAICSVCHRAKTLREAAGCDEKATFGADGWPLETRGVGRSLAHSTGTGGGDLSARNVKIGKFFDR